MQIKLCGRRYSQKTIRRTDERTDWQTDRKADLKQDDPSSRLKTRRMERIKVTPIFLPSDLIVFYGSQTIIIFGIYQTEYIHVREHLYVCVAKGWYDQGNSPGFSSWFTKRNSSNKAWEQFPVCVFHPNTVTQFAPVTDTNWWKTAKTAKTP